LLDVGCGNGDQLAAFAERFGCEAHGIDISVTTIEAAAKQHPRLQWVVANADRFLPYADASFRSVVSITAPMNAQGGPCHERIRHVAQLDAAAVADVMTSAYRALRAKERTRLAAIGDVDVTQSPGVLLFRPG
jgi:SAM-dependent methyltransferase